jgi:hypothetical protein
VKFFALTCKDLLQSASGQSHIAYRELSTFEVAIVNLPKQKNKLKKKNSLTLPKEKGNDLFIYIYSLVLHSHCQFQAKILQNIVHIPENILKNGQTVVFLERMASW